MKKVNIVLLAFFFCLALYADELRKVTKLEIENGYEAYLPARDRFLTQTGVKELKFPDGKTLRCCIVYTVYQGDSPLQQQKMITICKNKAMAEMLKSTSCKVYECKSLKTKGIEFSNGATIGYKNISEFLNVIQTEANGVITAWPVIATWVSVDKEIFYLATGCLYSKENSVIEPE